MNQTWVYVCPWLLEPMKILSESMLMGDIPIANSIHKYVSIYVFANKFVKSYVIQIVDYIYICFSEYFGDLLSTRDTKLSIICLST